MKGLAESIESGGSFSESLARYPNVFSRLYINMVRAGESAGILDAVLARLADYFEKMKLLKKEASKCCEKISKHIVTV